MQQKVEKLQQKFRTYQLGHGKLHIFEHISFRPFTVWPGWMHLSIYWTWPTMIKCVWAPMWMPVCECEGYWMHLRLILLIPAELIFRPKSLSINIQFLATTKTMMILCRNEVLHTNRTPESSAFSRCAELARKSVMRKDITVYISWIHSMSIIFQKSVPRVLEESVLCVSSSFRWTFV